MSEFGGEKREFDIEGKFGTYRLLDVGHPARMEAASKDDGDGWQMSCRVAMSEARFRSGVMAMVVFGAAVVTADHRLSSDIRGWGARSAQGGRRAILS